MDTKQLSNLIADAMLHQAWNLENPYVAIVYVQRNTASQDASLGWFYVLKKVPWKLKKPGESIGF